jgi:hypothetical protein
MDFERLCSAPVFSKDGLLLAVELRDRSPPKALISKYCLDGREIRRFGMGNPQYVPRNVRNVPGTKEKIV